MTSEELERIGRELYGKHWKSPLATALGIYTSTVNRWLTGYTPISRMAEMAIRLLVFEQKLQQPPQLKRAKEQLTVQMT